MHSNPFPCPECRGTADIMGDHQVGCGGNGDCISRHRDVLFTAAQSAALAPSKETPGLVPSSLSRPADILLPNWCQGHPATLDIHVIFPLQQSTPAKAPSSPGHALQVGTRSKLASNLSACRAVGAECIPLVAETLGGLSEDSIHTIRAIGHDIGLHLSSPNPSISSKHLFGRVAIALWRGNASLWLHSPLVSANPCRFRGLQVSQLEAPFSDARLMTRACSGSRADMNWVTSVLMKSLA